MYGHTLYYMMTYQFSERHLFVLKALFCSVLFYIVLCVMKSCVLYPMMCVVSDDVCCVLLCGVVLYCVVCCIR